MAFQRSSKSNAPLNHNLVARIVNSSAEAMGIRDRPWLTALPPRSSKGSKKLGHASSQPFPAWKNWLTGTRAPAYPPPCPPNRKLRQWSWKSCIQLTPGNMRRKTSL